MRHCNSGALLAYLNFARNKKLYPDNFEDKVKVHGGVAVGCMYFEDGYGCGINFMHSGDISPNMFPQGNKYWSFDDVEKHCKEIIDSAYENFN